MSDTIQSKTYNGRPHSILFVNAAGWVIGGVILKIMFMYQPFPGNFGNFDPSYLIPIIFAVLGILNAVRIAYYIFTTEYVVNADTISVKTGFFDRKTDQILPAKVEDISIDQSIFGAWFNYGDVKIIGTGGSFIRFKTASSPQMVKDLILNYSKLASQTR